MAALDRLDDLDEFLLELQPNDVFRPRRDVAVPGRAPRLHAPAHDRGADRDGARSSERRSPPRTSSSSSSPPTSAATPTSEGPPLRARLLLARRRRRRRWVARSWRRPRSAGSCCRSRVDGVIATDGGWVRNFPLEHAYRNPGRRRRSSASATSRPTAPIDTAFLERMRAAARALPRGTSGARPARGDPARRGARRGAASRRTTAEMIVRLMRVAIARNTVLEERLARRARDLRRRAPAPARGGDRGRRRRSAAAQRRTSCARELESSSRRRASRSATTATSRRSSSEPRRARTASTRPSAATSPGRTSASAPSSTAATGSQTRRSRRQRARASYPS